MLYRVAILEEAAAVIVLADGSSKQKDEKFVFSSDEIIANSRSAAIAIAGSQADLDGVDTSRISIIAHTVARKPQGNGYND